VTFSEALRQLFRDVLGLEDFGVLEVCLGLGLEAFDVLERRLGFDLSPPADFAKVDCMADTPQGGRLQDLGALESL
jgi:hypothetical protein